MAKVEQRQSLFTKVFMMVATAVVGLGVWLVKAGPRLFGP
jgi:hypothetical protein